MQREIGSNVKIGDSVTPFKSMGKSPVIDKTASDFDNANLQVKKIRRLIECGIYDADTAGYIPGTLDMVFQEMIEKIMTIEQPDNRSYKNKEVLDFELILDNNFYTDLKKPPHLFPNIFSKIVQCRSKSRCRYLPS